MLAGVSIATVSAVINNSAHVSPTRKKRVLDAMMTLDYHPDAIARGLKTGITNVIGVVVPDITNAFYPEVIRGVEDTARKAGYSVLLCDSNENAASETDHLNTLFSRRVDGVLLACCTGSTIFAAAVRRSLPVVFLDRLPPVTTEGTVSSDNIGAGAMATRYLIALGHEKIAMLAGHLGLSPHQNRLEGFRKAMQEANLPIRDEYLISGDVQIEDGYNACRRLLAIDPPPSAIMVSNNKLLLGVLQAIDELKIRVPDQLSILGFDDYVWNKYFNPSLTAVAQATYEMGKRACELLLQTIEQKDENQNLTENIVRLSTQLRIRNSTAPPQQGNSKKSESREQPTLTRASLAALPG
jgi:LacI family transcriptional regulator